MSKKDVAAAIVLGWMCVIVFGAGFLIAWTAMKEPDAFWLLAGIGAAFGSIVWATENI